MYLIEILKQRILSVLKKSYILLKIKYEQIFYKRRIIQALQNRIVKHYLLKSVKELFKISKIFMEYTMIWLINMIILTFKIPYLALIDTYKLIFKSFNFGYSKLMKIGS
jgi:hypothetical protein